MHFSGLTANFIHLPSKLGKEVLREASVGHLDFKDSPPCPHCVATDLSPPDDQVHFPHLDDYFLLTVHPLAQRA